MAFHIQNIPECSLCLLEIFSLIDNYDMTREGWHVSRVSRHDIEMNDNCHSNSQWEGFILLHLEPSMIWHDPWPTLGNETFLIETLIVHVANITCVCVGPDFIEIIIKELALAG